MNRGENIILDDHRVIGYFPKLQNKVKKEAVRTNHDLPIGFGTQCEVICMQKKIAALNPNFWIKDFMDRNVDNHRLSFFSNILDIEA